MFLFIQPMLEFLTLSPSLDSIFGVTIVLASFFISYRISWHPLSHIPGPTLAKVTGQWRSFRYWRGTWHDDILHLHRHYGRVVRIAPNEVSVVDGQAARLLYGPGPSALKTNWYKTWDSPVGPPSLFSIRDKDMHAIRRKRVAGAYSMSSVLRYESNIQQCLDLLVNKLENQARQGATINLSEWTSAFAYDVIGCLAYGAPLGQLESGSDLMGVRKLLYTTFSFNACIGHYPGQSWLLTNRGAQFLLGVLGKDHFTEFLRWTREKIESQMTRKANGERSNLLQHFVNMKDAAGSPVQLPDVISEAGSLVGAGADTTATAIRACLHEIYSRHEVLGRLRVEIDEANIANNNICNLTYVQCQKLPFLTAVIKESMRLSPSITFQLLRYTPPSGLMVDGKLIPPGYPVGISPLAQNRDVAIWGKDANDFQPERWLDPARSRYLDANDMSFGGNGARMCIGRNIALVEVFKSVAQIVRCLDLEIVYPQIPWRVASYWFSYQHDFIVKPRLRGSLV